MGNPVQVQVLLSARKLREVHSGVWAADASLLAGRRITIRVYTAIAVGQAFRRNACMHFDSKAENILFYECFSAFFFLKNCKNSVCSNQNSNKFSFFTILVDKASLGTTRFFLSTYLPHLPSDFLQIPPHDGLPAEMVSFYFTL